MLTGPGSYASLGRPVRHALHHQSPTDARSLALLRSQGTHGEAEPPLSARRGFRPIFVSGNVLRRCVKLYSKVANFTVPPNPHIHGVAGRRRSHLRRQVPRVGDGLGGCSSK